MCHAKEPFPFLKGQGHIYSYNGYVHAFLSRLYSCAWKDFKIIQHQVFGISRRCVSVK